MVDNSEQSVVCTGAQLASAAEFLLQGYILLEAGTWSLQTREYFHTLHMRNMHFVKEEGHGSVMAVSRACLYAGMGNQFCDIGKMHVTPKDRILICLSAWINQNYDYFLTS